MLSINKLVRGEVEPQKKLRTIGITAEEFSINGFEFKYRYFPSEVSQLLKILLPFTFVSSVNADLNQLITNYFQYNDTKYQFDRNSAVFSMSFPFTVSQTFNYIQTVCNGTLLEQVPSELFSLLKNITQLIRFDDTGRTETVIYERFWREENTTLQQSFEECVETMMNKPVEGEAWQLILATCLGVCALISCSILGGKLVVGCQTLYENGNISRCAGTAGQSIKQAISAVAGVIGSAPNTIRSKVTCLYSYFSSNQRINRHTRNYGTINDTEMENPKASEYTNKNS